MQADRTAQSDYTEDENGCWIWQRSLQRGYGRIKVAGKWRQAYRVYYERDVGPVPEGMTLDHTCRCKACVNPEHLEPVTQHENWRRSGAHLTTEDVRVIRQGGDLDELCERFDLAASVIEDVFYRRIKANFI